MSERMLEIDSLDSDDELDEEEDDDQRELEELLKWWYSEDETQGCLDSLRSLINFQVSVIPSFTLANLAR